MAETALGAAGAGLCCPACHPTMGGKVESMQHPQAWPGQASTADAARSAGKWDTPPNRRQLQGIRLQRGLPQASGPVSLCAHAEGQPRAALGEARKVSGSHATKYACRSAMSRSLSPPSWSPACACRSCSRPTNALLHTHVRFSSRGSRFDVGAPRGGASCDTMSADAGVARLPGPQASRHPSLHQQKSSLLCHAYA